MVHVLVTGAAGYIASEVAASLARNGHRVYGLVRKEEQAQELKKQEVIPVLVSITDLDVLEPVLERVEVIIDSVTLFGSSDPTKSTRDLIALAQKVAERTKTQKRFIYTSGILFYGDYGNQLVDESFPCKSPMMAWRAELEAFVTKLDQHNRVNGIVVRPGFVYGKSGGSMVPSWFQYNANGDWEFHGSTSKRWSTIHLADLANAYVGLTEAGSQVNGEVFDCVDYTRLTAAEIRSAFARHAGASGRMIELPAGTDYFSQVCEASCMSHSEKLNRFIGWSPKHRTILDNLDQLYQAVKAHQSS
jgi:nucleoside-diphosphate-sugar epimerase